MGWSTSITKQIFVFVIGLFLILNIVFPGKIYGAEWIFAAVLILVMVFSGINFFLSRWNDITETRFLYKLFWSALIIRIIVMLILLAVSFNTWNMFYVVGARDEMVYYRVASEACSIWMEQTIRDAYLHILESYKNDISDTGYSTFLMFPIIIFRSSPILIKIFLCFLGSFAVVRGYKLARLLTEFPIAKLAGILLILYPISWFYSAIMLKESLMVLLMIEALILIVKTQKTFKLKYLIKSMIFIGLLFFFRSPVSILLLLVLGFSFFMQYKIKNIFINVVLAGLVIILYIYFLKSTGRFDEYYDQYTNIDEFTQERLSYIESVNPFVALVGSPVFAALSYISPFPSVVSVPNAGDLSHSEYYYHIAGNIFWIVLSFFSIYGLYYSIRYKRREMVVLITFVIGYQFMLLKALMFTSVRFSYPVKPFLLILAAYGIYKINTKKWYPIYLVAALIMIVGWNYVRLKGRG
jgi:hypothetical protein